jgi:lipopolysaccharide transport system permease protein
MASKTAIPETNVAASRAFPRSLGRSVDVTLALAAADLRVRFGRGYGQLINWLLEPFFLVGVYLVLVVFVLNRPGHAPGLSLTCAVVPFQLISLTVANAMTAIVTRRSIILNMPFRRTLIPAASALTQAAAFGASLVLFVVLMAVYGVAPTPALLWLPVAVAITLLMALAFAYPAALFGLWFQDLRTLAMSVMRTLFFVAPGLVPLAEIPGKASDVVRLNPLTGVFETYRHALLYGTSPPAWELLYPTAFALALLILFVPLYRREQHQFAKVL